MTFERGENLKKRRKNITTNIISTSTNLLKKQRIGNEYKRGENTFAAPAAGAGADGAAWHEILTPIASPGNLTSQTANCHSKG